MRNKNPNAVALGARGGRKTAEKGPDFYKTIGMAGNKAQGKKLKA